MPTIRVPVAFVAFLLLVLAAPVHALDYDVDRTDDDATATACSALVDGDCTLRGAIIAANQHAGDDQINLPDGTYTLTIVGPGEDAAATGDLDVTDTLTIQGTSQTGTIIDGNELDRVIHSDPAGAGLIRLIIRQLTIQHGESPSAASRNAEGGGIRNGAGSTTVDHVAGIVNLVDVAVDSNTSASYGGGISNDGTMTLSNCLVSNNASGSLTGGAGIVQDDHGSLSISGSTIRDNNADANGTAAGEGGGLSIGAFSSNGSPTVDIEASTFRDNIARTAGGIRRIRGNVTMRNCTISGNHATVTGGTGAGGIGDSGFTNGLQSAMLLKSVTVTNNTSGLTDGGGGIEAIGSGIQLANTIVAGNRGGATPGNGYADGTPSDIIGTLISRGHNLIGKATGFTVAVGSDTTGDIMGVTVANLHLDPNLTHVGGPPTELHVLQAGSPAIDAGSTDVPQAPFGCANTDQRSSTRPRDGDGNGSEICDIGAYEVFDPFPAPTPTVTGAPGATPTLTATPTVLPTPNPGSEICDNCIDDDSDGLADRDDPGCDQPFDGAAAGLGDPAAGKRLVKCAGAIQKAGAKFASKRLGRLRKCLDTAFACTQLKGGDVKCINKATKACDKAFQGSVADETKLTATITKACGPDKVSTDALREANGLGYKGHEYRCETLLGAPLPVDAVSVAACVAREQTCRVDGVIGAEVPRASELLSLAGFSGNNLCPGSTVLAANFDGGLSDPKRAKLAVKCQAAIGKAGAKLVNAEVKTVPKCANAVLACFEVGKDGCAAKSRTTCTKLQGKIDALAGKLQAAITKACVTSGLTVSEAIDVGGVNLARLGPLCSSAATPLATVADVTACVTKLHQCRAHQMLENQLPRLRELLGTGQLALP